MPRDLLAGLTEETQRQEPIDLLASPQDNFSGDLPPQQMSPKFIIDTERKKLLHREAIDRGLIAPPEDVAKQDEPMPWTDVFEQAFQNTPESAEQYIKDIISPFLNPIETAKAVKGLAQGIGQKFTSGIQEQEAMVDNLGAMLKERYGGVENLKKTLAKDPAGFAGDIATLLIPAGKIAQTIGTVSKTSKVAKVGKAIAKAGEIAEPLTAVGKIAKQTARAVIPKGLSTNLYQGAAKFSTVLPEATRKALINTALERRLMPTLDGLNKLRSGIDDLKKQITAKVDLATAQGKNIPVEDVLEPVYKLRKEQTLMPKAISRKKAIDKIIKEMRTENRAMGRKKYTPAEAQKMKVDIHKELESSYSKMSADPIDTQTQKSVAKGARKNLEKIIPGIKQLNKTEGSLIALEKELERAASRISNRDITGIGAPVKAVAGEAVGGPVGAAVGVSLGILDFPRVKAKLAIVVDSLKKKGIALPEDSLMSKILGTTPTGAVTTRQAGKLTEALEEEPALYNDKQSFE